MCGIIGAVSDQDIVNPLINGLKRLAYRGYDSAGIATLHDKTLCRLRTTGKIQELENLIKSKTILGNIGIAHTRWATHGVPNEANAHPHIAGNTIAIVHNGIIENHHTIRADLLNQACELQSETDSELIAHLIYLKTQQGDDLLTATQKTLGELQGSFAIAVISKNEPGRLIAARKGSPLVIGETEHGYYIASDGLSILPLTQKFIYLEEGDSVEIKRDHFQIYDAKHSPVTRKIHEEKASYSNAEKGDYAHYMLKEIFEQPKTIAHTLEGRISDQHVLVEAFGPHAEKIFQQTKRIQIVACGTSFHAGLVAKYWIEDILHLPCQVEIASEYRYRNKVVEPNTLFVVLSQSGETADTLAALKLAQNEKNHLGTLAICNVPNSSIVREADLNLMMNAGPEIGVASTKAFTSQLISLFLMVLALNRFHHFDEKKHADWITKLLNLPALIDNALDLNIEIEKMAQRFLKTHSAIFLGRGIEYPIALEGALKLKEISYIHAEAFPAGELKHGPLALVEKDMPVVALSSDDALADKLKSNLEEVKARGGSVFLFTHETIKSQKDFHVITMPPIDAYLAPILYAVPMQLLAYHVAVLKGTDIDQPRNLAKSVTVE